VSKEIRNIICAVIAAALAIGFISIFFLLGEGGTEKEKVKVGFIYDGDAGTPYSANFMIAARSLTAEYGEKAELIEKYNIPHENAAEIIDGLVRLRRCCKEGSSKVFGGPVLRRDLRQL